MIRQFKIAVERKLEADGLPGGKADERSVELKSVTLESE